MSISWQCLVILYLAIFASPFVTADDLARRKDLAGLSAHQQARRADANAAACSELAVKNGNHVVTPQDGAVYTTLREQHFSQTAWKSPLCIFTPGSVNELADAIKYLSSTNATVAIRGGGHSPLPAWANTDGGVLISTKGINDLDYNAALQTVRAGMGNTWGNVFEYTEAFGRIVVGGRAPTVGLATMLGGGISALSNKYGFVSDNVLSFEVLLSNGTLVEASLQANEDLFYALKAGSNNFGVVTHATMSTFPGGKVWGGAIIYTNDQRDAIMQAFATYQQSGQLDTSSSLLSYMGINNDTIYVLLAYMDAVERPAAFQPFYSIPSVYDGTQFYSNYTELIKVGINLVVPRWTWGATTFLLDNSTYVDVAKIAQNATTALAGVNGGTMVLMPQPISSSMVKESQERGTNPMVTDLTASPQMWFSINVGWNFASDDDKIDQILTNTLSSIEALTKSRNLYLQFIFPNDAHQNQDPLRSFGMNTYRKLERIAREVDSVGFFQKNVPGGFKV